MGKKANLNYKLCGVGINDSDHRVGDCPYYARWTSILKRCYSKTLQNKQPTYKGCSICKEWVYFSNFETWMKTQDWEGKYLDKDLLVRGNKEYSPDTCIFVSNKVNAFLAIYSPKLKESKLPIGVTKSKGKFISQASDGKGIKVSLGTYETPEDAHNAWKKQKLSVLKDLIASEDEDVQGILKGLKDILEESIESGGEITKEDFCGRK